MDPYLSTMENNLVSIIMPAYNGERFIEQAIRSVIDQSYENWELLVIDDGSTDNTAKIVASFIDPRIHYVFQENRGQAAALNHGLDLAKGEYITTLDVDDWYTKDSLKARVDYLEANSQYGVVYGDGIYCSVDGNSIMRFSEYRIGDLEGDVYATLIASPFFGTGGNVLVWRDVLEEHHIRYDESIVWCQDYDFYIRISEHTTFGLIDTITIWYRLHKENMTMSMPKGNRLESLLRLRIKILSSMRFAQVDDYSKYQFFRNLILHDLNSLFNEQVEMLGHPCFQGMEKKRQVQIIRQLATDYLIIRKHIDEVRVLLKRAQQLSPFESKTFILILLGHLQGSLADRLFEYWRRIKLQKHKTLSPLARIQEGHF